MADVATIDGLEALKRELEAISGARASVAPQLSDAILGMLTAVRYADDALLASSFHSLLACLADVARDIIHRELTAAHDTKGGIRRGWQTYIDGMACENLDELKNVIESLIDERIASMTRIRDKLVKALEEKDYHVANGQQLEDGIRDLREFRESLLKSWPSSRKRPSPINRKAIAEAREAIARGDKGMRKEELIWGAIQAVKPDN